MDRSSPKDMAIIARNCEICGIWGKKIAMWAICTPPIRAWLTRSVLPNGVKRTQTGDVDTALSMSSVSRRSAAPISEFVGRTYPAGTKICCGRLRTAADALEARHKGSGPVGLDEDLPTREAIRTLLDDMAKLQARLRELESFFASRRK